MKLGVRSSVPEILTQRTSLEHVSGDVVEPEADRGQLAIWVPQCSLG